MPAGVVPACYFFYPERHMPSHAQPSVRKNTRIIRGGLPAWMIAVVADRPALREGSGQDVHFVSSVVVRAPLENRAWRSSPYHETRVFRLVRAAMVIIDLSCRHSFRDALESVECRLPVDAGCLRLDQVSVLLLHASITRGIVARFYILEARAHKNEGLA